MYRSLHPKITPFVSTARDLPLNIRDPFLPSLIPNTHIPQHVSPSIALLYQSKLCTPLCCQSGSSPNMLPLLVPYCINYKKMHPTLLSLWILPLHITSSIALLYQSKLCTPLCYQSGSFPNMLPF